MTGLLCIVGIVAAVIGGAVWLVRAGAWQSKKRWDDEGE